MEDFCLKWIVELGKVDKRCLAIFLCHMLVKHMMQATAVANQVTEIIGKSSKTARNGELLSSVTRDFESKQGKYNRKGILWHNAELNKLATQYIRNNSAVKGKPNMTTHDFCKWVKNLTLELAFPQRVSVATCRRLLIEMGFEVITPRKRNLH